MDDSPVPKYVKIREHLFGEIRSGRLVPGSRAPSESDLMERFSVSRGTARKALDDLVHEGLLVRVQGKGTYVSAGERFFKEKETRRDVGIILPYMRELGMHILSGAESALSQYGYRLVFRSSNLKVEQERVMIRRMRDEGAVGMIVYSLEERGECSELRRLREGGYPFVLIDRYIPDMEADAVTSDNYGGARQVMEHLLDMGHRRIAIVTIKIDHFTTSVRDRFRAYREALEEHGIALDPSLVMECATPQISPGSSPTVDVEIQDEYTSALDKLLSARPRPTAIFALNDRTALYIFNYLSQRGIDVPREISLVGFDDEIFAQHLRVPLTTVFQNFQEMGRQAVELLVDKISGRVSGPKHIVLPTRLVVRESTAPPGDWGDSK